MIWVTRLLTIGMLVAAVGCGGAAIGPSTADGVDPGVQSDPAGPDEEDESAAAAASSSTDDEGAASPAEPPASSKPSRSGGPPVLAIDSDPPGLKPLSDSEKKELPAKCEPLIAHLKGMATRDRGRKKAADYVEQLAAKPPAIAGVDVPRCTELLLRDTRAYVARTIENQAIMNLKRIMVGLADAHRRDGRLCPSAPTVPKRIAAVAEAPYQAEPAEWHAAGWRCVGFDTHRAPQRFQYELKTDSNKQSFEIIARGYPVRRGPMVELFLPGAVKGGAIELSSSVYRR